MSRLILKIRVALYRRRERRRRAVVAEMMWQQMEESRGISRAEIKKIWARDDLGRHARQAARADRKALADGVGSDRQSRPSQRVIH